VPAIREEERASPLPHERDARVRTPDQRRTQAKRARQAGGVECPRTPRLRVQAPLGQVLAREAREVRHPRARAGGHDVAQARQGRGRDLARLARS
jgi:hypothetical protein